MLACPHVGNTRGRGIESFGRSYLPSKVTADGAPKSASKGNHERGGCPHLDEGEAGVLEKEVYSGGPGQDSARLFKVLPHDKVHN